MEDVEPMNRDLTPEDRRFIRRLDRSDGDNLLDPRTSVPQPDVTTISVEKHYEKAEYSSEYSLEDLKEAPMLACISQYEGTIKLTLPDTQDPSDELLCERLIDILSHEYMHELIMHLEGGDTSTAYDAFLKNVVENSDLHCELHGKPKDRVSDQSFQPYGR